MVVKNEDRQREIPVSKHQLLLKLYWLGHKVLRLTKRHIAPSSPIGQAGHEQH
jgi:hypothetical protein